MRAIPFLALLLLSSPIAGASTELELLQDRCSEQERQIRQLEEENSRLKSLVNTAAATPAIRSTPAAEAEVSTARETSGGVEAATYGTVRAGDSLSKIAKRHGTTQEALIKLNKLKNPSLISPGQKLLLPGKPSAAPRPSNGVGRTHIVKTGETFYSIARQHGLSSAALEAANPSVKANALRPGQKLQLARAAEPAPAVKETALASAPVTQLASTTPAPAPLESTASQTVSSAPRIKSVLVTEETDFSAFAAAHGTTTEKLNALNGHNLKPSTVLAKGSEFYVPAQP